MLAHTLDLLRHFTGRPGEAKSDLVTAGGDVERRRPDDLARRIDGRVARLRDGA